MEHKHDEGILKKEIWNYFSGRKSLFNLFLQHSIKMIYPEGGPLPIYV